MGYVSTFLIACSIQGLLCLCYLGIRNQKVYRFRINTLYRLVFRKGEDGLGSYVNRQRIADKVGYNDMVMSFKPLKLEAWYSPEDIETLTQGESE